MLDRYVVPAIKPGLRVLAGPLVRLGISADQVTVTGFALGLLAVPLIVLQYYTAALILVLLNRLADGLDGEMARLRTPSDAGGFLDISLDFIFYQAVVFAFALADPRFTFWALLLMLSFVGTGITFLAFAVMAERHGVDRVQFPGKSMHYLGGLTEGTETVLVFAAFCLWPQHFPWLAGGFALVCVLTTVMRLRYGYRTLKTLNGSPGN